MSLAQLQPSLLWSYFEKITQIPRPSHHEEAIEQFILDEAKRLGLEAQKDEGNNVLVRKKASAGYEGVAGVILQCHLDMVAQKNSDSSHNFLTDPIEAYIDGDWVRAKGTTLGADNGIGVAAALAILADDTLPHPPLEALFTATEETGMDGAKQLRRDWLKGKYLINLDSETIGEICVGCAGGIDATFTLPLSYEAIPYKNPQAFTISISGLLGGHSGIDIDKNRGNAIVLLARFWQDLQSFFTDLRVFDLQGGSLRNAIPREAQLSFICDGDIACADEDGNPLSLSDALEACVATELEEGKILRTLTPAERQTFNITVEAVQLPKQVWQEVAQQRVLDTLRVFPNGVERMSVDVAGLVDTSSNLAKIETTANDVEGSCLLRAANDDSKDDLALKMQALMDLAGGTIQFSGAYPGWRPQPDSKIVHQAIKAGEQVLGYTPKVTMIHAGLECGLLGEHYPNWEMLSLGPTIEAPHSPDERVNIKSVAQFWDWLLAILASR